MKDGANQHPLAGAVASAQIGQALLKCFSRQGTCRIDALAQPRIGRAKGWPVLICCAAVFKDWLRTHSPASGRVVVHALRVAVLLQESVK